MSHIELSPHPWPKWQYFRPTTWHPFDDSKATALVTVGRGWDSVAALGSFPLYAYDYLPAGYSIAATSITPPPGTYRVRFDGRVWGTDAAESVAVAFFDDAAFEASHSTPIINIADPLEFRVESTITISGALSVRNGSGTYAEYIQGCLRIDPA